MIVLRMAKEARAHFLVRAGEWFFASEMALIGISLLVSGGDTFRSARVYALMNKMACEDVWAALALGIAVARIVALFVNGTVPGFARYSPIARGLLSIISGMVWICIALAFFLVNPKGMLHLPIAGFGLADFILSAIIADEAGLVERRARDAGRSV